MVAIGIDLGTTNSVAAYYNGEKSTIITLDPNDLVTPSVVSYDRETSKFLVGRPALNRAPTRPKNTIFSIKRLMGCSMDNPRVNDVRKRYPYDIVSSSTDHQVCVGIEGVKYTPVAISSMILEKIVQDANEFLHEPVSHVVITVPAYFEEPQREDTRKAGVRANLLVKKLIDEPTAAAIAYGMQPEQFEKDQFLLVFDFGGGTLDISILESGQGMFEVETYAGDMWLGGDDFDNEIVDLIADWVVKTHGCDLSDDKEFQAIVKRHAEAAKIELTEYDEVEIIIPAIVPFDGGGRGGINMVLTRQDFDAAITPLVDRAMRLVEQALAKGDLKEDDIDKVLLVGGSTYVPLVREKLAERFGEEKILHDIDPMLAVAQGASILAESLNEVLCPKCGEANDFEAEVCAKCQESLSTAQAEGGVGLTERTPESLGIASVDQFGNTDRFAQIIPANTVYPLDEPGIGQRFQTVGRKITIPVYEGSNEVASKNVYLGKMEIELPPDVPQNTPVKVFFNYNRHRVVTVRVEVENRSDLTEEKKLARDRYVVTEGPNGELNDQWNTNLLGTLKIMDEILTSYGEFITTEERAAITEDIQRGRAALSTGDDVIGRDVSNRLLHKITSSNTASYLFLGERMMRRSGAENAALLAQYTMRLREAHAAKDQVEVGRMKQNLDGLLTTIFSELGGSDIEGEALLRQIGSPSNSNNI